MNRTSFQETDAFLDRSMRVLLCMSNSRDRELVADQLRSASLDIVVYEGGDELPQFDLCVVDTELYPSVAQAVEERRQRLGAVHLPLLLVLGPNDSEAKLGPSLDHIDDVIAVPTAGEIFTQRVTALLRIKKQSEQLALFARAMDDAPSGISISDARGDEKLRYVNDGSCRGRRRNRRPSARCAVPSTAGNRSASRSGTTGKTGRCSGTNWR